MRSASIHAFRRESIAAALFLIPIAVGAAARHRGAQQAGYLQLHRHLHSSQSADLRYHVRARGGRLRRRPRGTGQRISPSGLFCSEELLSAHGPAVEALRSFYRDHAFEDPGETLSPYMTFAIIAGPPPQFQLPGEAEALPPDISSIDGFQPILSAFYKEERLDRWWAGLEPQYEASVDSYRLTLMRTSTVVNAYLREVLRPSSGRSFMVDFEPLAGARTNFRNYGDSYTLVAGAPSEASVDAMRHAYLHFMIDPLVLRNRAALEKRRTIVDIAARAPQLPPEYQNDIVGLLDESLIKAVELRLNNLSPDKLPGRPQRRRRIRFRAGNVRCWSMNCDSLRKPSRLCPTISATLSRRSTTMPSARACKRRSPTLRPLRSRHDPNPRRRSTWAPSSSSGSPRAIAK